MLRTLLVSTDWVAYKTGERTTRGTVARLAADNQVRNWKLHTPTDDMIEND